MPDLWSRKRVCVTAGAGFLGSYVVERLQQAGCRDVLVPRQCDYDLTSLAAIQRLYAHARLDLVIHLAASVGGSGANREHPPGSSPTNE